MKSLWTISTVPRCTKKSVLIASFSLMINSPGLKFAFFTLLDMERRQPRLACAKHGIVKKRRYKYKQMSACSSLGKLSNIYKKKRKSFLVL